MVKAKRKSGRRKGKGTFGRPGLPIADRYPTPPSRNRLVLLGAFGVLVLGGYALADLFLGDAGFVSNGPLSSAHAVLESDCSSCHVEMAGFGTHQGLPSENCSVCHEKYGDQLGVYSFAAHYVYRSDDFGRVGTAELEVSCSACHTEHQGRGASITDVSDARCLTCHDYGSFNRGHPQFDVAVEKQEASTLTFAHIHHVREVMKTQQLVDVERACLYCHSAQADGRSFEPLSFDRHCDSCHLTATTATERLPIGTTGGRVGVETLEMLRDRRPPGSHWTLFANPTEYRVSQGTVRKAPLHHRDPWILTNLRRLRQQLYPDGGLADLLVASPDAPPSNIRALYREAVTTLRERVIELRAHGERRLQRQLRQAEQLLVRVERALEDPATPLDETRFLLDLLEQDPELPSERVEEIEALVESLTEACRECHQVEKATIARVAADQRSMRRAQFDHRSHIIQRRCLDCHTEIPFLEHLSSEDSEDSENSVDPALDRAEIVNLPGAEVCKECHNPKMALNRCSKCHFFHPDKGRHRELLLYLETP